MIEIRGAKERGYAEHGGWLKSYHSFSFAEYFDRNHMHFGPLRVINEDWIAAGMGFGMHPHKDMEIITYVLEGELAHRDSMGNGSTIRPGNVQRMSAGRGVTHSEFNHMQDAEVHLLQIWIMPNRAGVTPSYEEKHFSAEEKRGTLRLVASEDGAQGSVQIHQDAKLYVSLLNGTEAAELPLAAGRLAYVHVARGSVTVNGQTLQAGDAAKLRGEPKVTLTQGQQAEVLVFDLPEM